MSNTDQRGSAYRSAQSRLAEEAQQRFEQLARQDRHTLVNTRAAARLLIGAFAMGDLSRGHYVNAFRSLTRSEGANLIDLESHAHEAEALRQTMTVRQQRPLSKYLPAGCSVLIVDDQFETAGWKPFFNAVFRDRTLFASNLEEASRIIGQSASQLALVLLDLRIPNDPSEGMSLLRTLKSQHLALPVIVFSGVDEIRFVRKCISLGADDYFVKELGDADRTSIAYYDKFRQVVIDALANPDVRDIWRLIEQLPKPVSCSRSSELLDDFLRHLRRAFYFLSADEDDVRARLLTKVANSDSYLYAHCVLECGGAVEHLVRMEYNRLSKKSQAARNETNGKAVGKKSKIKPTFNDQLLFLRREGLLTTENIDIAQKIWRARSKAAHGKFVPRKQAVDTFHLTLTFYEAFASHLDGAA